MSARKQVPIRIHDVGYFTPNRTQVAILRDSADIHHPADVVVIDRY
jgi:hypothetical protein